MQHMGELCKWRSHLQLRNVHVDTVKHTNVLSKLVYPEGGEDTFLLRLLIAKLELMRNMYSVYTITWACYWPRGVHVRYTGTLYTQQVQTV